MTTKHMTTKHMSTKHMSTRSGASKMKFANKNRQGFTYIEVILAAMVTTVGLVGYAASLISTHDLRASTAETIRAMNIARYAIEEIEAIDDIDYVINNLNGFSFTVPNLEGPDTSKTFADGTTPRFYLSTALPPLEEEVVEVGGTVGGALGEIVGGTSAYGIDPALGAEYEYQPVALEPAYDSRRGFGQVTVDATNPDLIRVDVSVQFRTARGNRKITFRSHMVRPFDPASFTF